MGEEGVEEGDEEATPNCSVMGVSWAGAEAMSSMSLASRASLRALSSASCEWWLSATLTLQSSCSWCCLFLLILNLSLEKRRFFIGLTASLALVILSLMAIVEC